MKDDLNRHVVLDNSRLEELMDDDVTSEIKNEFLNLLKDSRLFLPVVFRRDVSEFLNDGDKHFCFGFDIAVLPGSDVGDVVPLFTSLDFSQKIRGSFISISMRDLAEILKQTDEYSKVSINFKGQFEMTVDEFLSLFGMVANHEIRNLKNDELIGLLEKDISDDELQEKLMSSKMIVPCIVESEDVEFYLTYDDEDRSYLPLFTDLDEFKKAFEDDMEELYPQAYHFRELLKGPADKIAINYASQCFSFSPEALK